MAMKVKVAVCGKEARVYKNVSLKDDGPYRFSFREDFATHGAARQFAAEYENRYNKAIGVA